jgi:hypothetical protein
VSGGGEGTSARQPSPRHKLEVMVRRKRVVNALIPRNPVGNKNNKPCFMLHCLCIPRFLYNFISQIWEQKETQYNNFLNHITVTLSNASHQILEI